VSHRGPQPVAAMQVRAKNHEVVRIRVALPLATKMKSETVMIDPVSVRSEARLRVATKCHADMINPIAAILPVQKIDMIDQAAAILPAQRTDMIDQVAAILPVQKTGIETDTINPTAAILPVKKKSRSGRHKLGSRTRANGFTGASGWEKWWTRAALRLRMEDELAGKQHQPNLCCSFLSFSRGSNSYTTGGCPLESYWHRVQHCRASSRKDL
jgi:hypothetical protein